MVTDLSALFAAIYTNVAAQRAALALPALVPDNLPIVGGELAPVAQIAPRIVIVPTRGELNFTQQMPVTQTPQAIGRQPYKSVLTHWLNFDVQCWGDPDTTPRPTGGTTAPRTPDPIIGFNTSLELMREFVIGCTTAMGSPTNQGWSLTGTEWVTANLQNNRYGRLLVLSFRVATPVTEAPYVILPYSQTPADGGVTGTINVEAELQQGTPETVATFVVPPPDPNAP
jgi:hypothetical protein